MIRITQLVELAAAILATVLNLILVPIILTKSSIKMGPYKYFLLAYTVTAAIYSYCVSTALFTWYLPKNGFLFMCTVEIFPRWFGGLQLMLFAICYLSTTIILVWSFIYRLSTLQSSFKWVMKRRFLPLAIIVSAFPLAVTVVLFIYMVPSEKTESAYREEVLHALDLDLHTIFYVGGLFIVGHLFDIQSYLQIDGEFNLPLVLILGTCCVFFTIGIVICVVCWLKIGSKLKELRRLTSSNYKYHHSFYILLALQTCLPVIFYASPITILIVMGFTQISIEGFSYLCGMCLSFAQVIDPLLTIYFISDYKRFLKRKNSQMLKYLGISPPAVHVFNTDISASTGHIRP